MYVQDKSSGNRAIHQEEVKMENSGMVLTIRSQVPGKGKVFWGIRRLAGALHNSPRSKARVVEASGELGFVEPEPGTFLVHVDTHDTHHHKKIRERIQQHNFAVVQEQPAQAVAAAY